MIQVPANDPTSSTNAPNLNPTQYLSHSESPGRLSGRNWVPSAATFRADHFCTPAENTILNLEADSYYLHAQLRHAYGHPHIHRSIATHYPPDPLLQLDLSRLDAHRCYHGILIAVNDCPHRFFSNGPAARKDSIPMHRVERLPALAR